MARVKPPTIRRRGEALAPFYQATEHAFPNAESTQKHRNEGRPSASTFLVECAAEDADEIVPVVRVLLRDIGTEVIVTGCGVDDAAPQTSTGALYNLVSYGLLLGILHSGASLFGTSSDACSLARTSRSRALATATRSDRRPVSRRLRSAAANVVERLLSSGRRRYNSCPIGGSPPEA